MQTAEIKLLVSVAIAILEVLRDVIFIIYYIVYYHVDLLLENVLHHDRIYLL